MDATKQLEALRRRVNATRQPKPAPTPEGRPLDIGAAVRAELARQATEAAEATRRAEAAAWLMPEPCVFCGYSGENGGERDPDTDRVTPWVWQAGRGPACSGCWVDSHPFGTDYQVSDDEHREKVLRRLLGAAADGWTPEHLMDRTGGGWRWFGELAGAQPSDAARFAYITADDVAAMAARLAPPERYTSHGEACPHCGSSSTWDHQPEMFEPVKARPGVWVPATRPATSYCRCGFWRQAAPVPRLAVPESEALITGPVDMNVTLSGGQS